MSTEDIKKIKVWVTEKDAAEPSDSNLAIERNISQSELTKPFNFDIWADFISDGKPKKKVTDISFTYGETPPIGEIVVSIHYIPPQVEVGTIVSLDGIGTKPSSSNAQITSWKWQVRNEGGMTYPITNLDKPQASFTTPDLNWMYVSLEVRDSNNKTAKKEIMIDIGEPQQNNPPISDAGIDKVVEPKSNVILDGSSSYDPDNDPLTYTWTQLSGKTVQIINATNPVASFVAPDLGEPIDEPKAIIKVPSVVPSLTQVIIDGTESIADNLEVKQVSGDYIVSLSELAKWKWQFTAPDGDFQLGFQGTATKGSKQSIVQVAIQVTKQPQGDYNEHGTRLLYKTTGKRVTMLKGSAHENGQRYNVNHKYQNYMMIGYYKIPTNGKLCEMKTDGPNHGGCDQLPECMWYEPKIDVTTGKVLFAGEWPHPDGHENLPTDFLESLPQGDYRGKWIGYAVIAYYNKEGFRTIEQYDDTNPFDNTGKPLNNWHLNLRAVEKGQIFPKEYFPRTLPVDFDEGLEAEIRQHCGAPSVGADFKWAYVYEIAQPTIMRFGTKVKSGYPTTNKCKLYRELSSKEDIDLESGKCDPDSEYYTRSSLQKDDFEGIDDTIPKATSETLVFGLTVTDSKGASNTDSVTITVQEGTPTKQNPIASFSYSPASPKEGDTVTLDSSSSYDPDGQIVSRLWTSPDVSFINPTGTVSTFLFPSGKNSVNISLTVTDNDGLTTTKTVTITKAPPIGQVVKIGHIGDTHGNHTGFKLLKTRENCNFILHSGDFTDTESDDDGYIQATKDVGLQYGVDFANSQGNHSSSEEGGEGAQEDAEAAFPVLKSSKWLQFYVIKNVAIIINNTQLPNYSQLDSEASKHVQSALVKAKELLDKGEVDWVFFMQHKPMWIIRNSGHSAEYNFRYVFHPMLDQYGVDIFLSGHCHLEQRTLPLIFPGEGTNLPPRVNSKMVGDAHDFGSVKPHGIICCPNGSSTKSHSLDEDTNAWTAYASDSGNAYTVFEIDGKKLTGKFIDISSGNVRHQFKVTKETTTPHECPTGQEWSEQYQKCIPICKPEEHYDPNLDVCVPDVVEPAEFTFNISGDFRDTPESGDNLISDKPNLILCTGDYGIAQDPEDWLNQVMDQWRDSGIETWGALGNHDDEQDYLALNFFKNTSWSWAIKKGKICFVAANTIDENVADTDKLLAQAQADTEIDKIIVLMHEGIFHPVGTSVSSDTTIEFHNSFKKYSKVRAVVCGHTHVYGRMKPKDNVLYIMNGIGGQSPSSGSTSPSPFHKINGALHCKALKDGSIYCECIPNSGDSPNIMDKFTINADGSLPTDGVDMRPRDGD